MTATTVRRADRADPLLRTQRRHHGSLALLAAAVLVIMPTGASQASPPGPPPRSTTVLTGVPHSASEAAVAVDPDDDEHLAVAENMYMPGPRVKVVESRDGGTTWTEPLDVTPSGFSKSYDPTILFVEGVLEVVAGASANGAAYCQPGSAVAVMTVHPDRTFTTRFAQIAQAPNHYVDRPTAAVDAESGRLYVTWTASSGPGAECRGTPASSQIVLATADGDGPFAPAAQLGTNDTVAPFGASIAVDRDGTVWAAVGGHDPDRRSQLAVVSSTDGGRSFGPSSVLAEGPPTPKRIVGLAGLNAPIPSIAVGAGNRIIVAWPMATASGATVRVFMQSGGEWHPLAPFATAGVPFLAAAALTDGGQPVVLCASVAGPVVTFEARSFPGEWTPPTPIADSPAGGYQEIGEGLGLAMIGDVAVMAVPVDGPTNSSLLIARQRFASPAPPPAPSTSATTTTRRTTTPPTSVTAGPRPRPTTPEQPRSSSRPPLGWLVVFPLVVVAVIGAGLWGRRHRRVVRSKVTMRGGPDDETGLGAKRLKPDVDDSR